VEQIKPSAVEAVVQPEQTVPAQSVEPVVSEAVPRPVDSGLTVEALPNNSGVGFENSHIIGGQIGLREIPGGGTELVSKGNLIGVDNNFLVKEAVLKPNYTEAFLDRASELKVSARGLGLRREVLSMDLRQYYLLKQGLSAARERGDTGLVNAINDKLGLLKTRISSRYGDILQ